MRAQTKPFIVEIRKRRLPKGCGATGKRVQRAAIRLQAVQARRPSSVEIGK